MAKLTIRKVKIQMKNQGKTQLKHIKDKGIISFTMVSEKSIEEKSTNQQKKGKKDRNR